MRVTREGIFFAGQYFDALKQIREIISQAQRKMSPLTAMLTTLLKTALAQNQVDT